MNSTPEQTENDSISESVQDVTTEAIATEDVVLGGSVAGDVASEDVPSEEAANEDVPFEVDARLLETHDLARAALVEITPGSTIGLPVGYTPEGENVVSLRFETLLRGYPGWFWTVSVARVDDAEPTVLEVELLPGDDALLAPDWVPWALRLADYQAAQRALAEAGVAIDADDLDADGLDDDDEDDDDDDDVEDELDDVEDLDAADFDEDASPILHAGDLDGVDIDELDQDAPDDDELDDDDDVDDDDELSDSAESADDDESGDP